MARRNKKGRAINGIIVVDKPTGRSSNHVLQQVKRLFNAKKAGHTGNLDPLATGVLPICLGEATKVSAYLLDGDKRYQVTCQLGQITDSADSDGKVIAEVPIPEFTEQQLLAILADFEGEQQQVPPMYSALKVNGKPLYKYALQGVEVERKVRTVTIHSIELLSFEADSFTLEVSCSKGTYIRTLVEDISQAMQSGGHVVMLRRIASAGYDIKQAVTLETLERSAEQGMEILDHCLLPTEEALPHWPSVDVSEQQVIALRHGQEIQVDQAFKSADVRLFDEQKQFLGLGKMSEMGVVAPKRVFVDEKQD